MDLISDKVKEIIADQLGLTEAPKDEARFLEDLGADSLDRVSLTMAIEEHFNIDIPDETAQTILTVDALVQFVARTAES
jgi:acyl carrier protein